MSAKLMVETQLKPRGICDARVLSAVSSVARERFVPESYRQFAYSDCPLPLSDGQTISQPYMVAVMTELLRPKEDSIILEIGTGSGYQTAVLAEIVAEVYTIEIVERLARASRTLLTEIGYRNVFYKIGDGYHGWPEHEPYDGIIVTAAPEEIPCRLAGQLKAGGFMVIPVGSVSGNQVLYVVEKQENGALSTSAVMDVRFVPMTGNHG